MISLFGFLSISSALTIVSNKSFLYPVFTVYESSNTIIGAVVSFGILLFCFLAITIVTINNIIIIKIEHIIAILFCLEKSNRFT